MCQPKDPFRFNTLLELTDYFTTEKKCLEYLRDWLWEGKVRCYHCKFKKVYKMGGGKLYKCASCRKPFSLKMGTMFESSKLPLRKWYAAIYLVANNKKGISSIQLAATIGVTQKTSWFMLTKIRSCMHDKDDSQLEGAVMCDESFVGGKNKNRHLDKRVKKANGRMYVDKVTVLGMMEYGGRVRTRAIAQPKSIYILPQVYQHIKPKSIIVSDEWAVYQNMSEKYEFETQMVRHAKKQFMNDCGFTTNPLEGFWASIKRTYNGTYHNMSRKHIQRDLDEITFRYNYREFSPTERLNLAMGKASFVLTQKQITNEKKIPDQLIIPEVKRKRKYQWSGEYIGKFTGKNQYGQGNQDPAGF